MNEVHAGVQRPRHVLAQDEELRHAQRCDHVAVDLAVRLEARHRAQQSAPLVIVDRAADVGRRRQQRVVLHVQDPCRVVGAFDVRPKPDEVIRLVAQHGAEGHTPEEVRAHLHPVEEFGYPAALDPRVVVLAHLEPRRVQVFVHLRGDRAAHRARRFARGAQAAEDRRGIARVEDHVAQHVLGGKLAEMRVVVGRESGSDERHRPRLRPGEARLGHVVGQQRHPVRHIEQPRGVLGALDVARHPEELVCSTAEHRRR